MRGAGHKDKWDWRRERRYSGSRERKSKEFHLVELYMGMNSRPIINSNTWYIIIYKQVPITYSRYILKVTITLTMLYWQ